MDEKERVLEATGLINSFMDAAQVYVWTKRTKYGVEVFLRETNQECSQFSRWHNRDFSNPIEARLASIRDDSLAGKAGISGWRPKYSSVVHALLEAEGFVCDSSFIVPAGAWEYHKYYTFEKNIASLELA